MKGVFQGFTAVWHAPTGQWPVWIVARTRAHAGVCAIVTFALLDNQARGRPAAP
jgi:hypothetical protein